jgi:hypothetical protein
MGAYAGMSISGLQRKVLRCVEAAVSAAKERRGDRQSFVEAPSPSLRATRPPLQFLIGRPVVASLLLNTIIEIMKDTVVPIYL